MKFFVFLALSAGLLLAASCEKIEEVATVPVSVPDFTIQVPVSVEETEQGNETGETSLNHFSGQQIFDMNDPEIDFEELKPYRGMLNLITSLKIGSATVKITSETGTFVENTVISAEGVGEYRLENYTFGDTYSDAALTAFATDLFKKFIASGQVSLGIDGYTDAQSGNDLTVEWSFTNVTVKAKIFD
ncbi:MAG: hypothetical protein LBR75_04785 [Prevotellaceae bacterium]|nr:hypothetical protein [Prevotellaceae bacterium]